MRLSTRRENLLKAIHALNLEGFTAADIVKRTAGLAIREPGNKELHAAIVGALGAGYSVKSLAQLLGKMSAHTFGDLVLAPEGSTRVPARYYVVTVEMLRTEAMSELEDEKARAVIAAEGKRWRCHPDDVTRLLSRALGGSHHRLDRDIEASVRKRERMERAEQAEADRAKVNADPELRDTFRAVVCGKDGRPEPVLDFHEHVTGAGKVEFVEYRGEPGVRQGKDANGRWWDIVEPTNKGINWNEGYSDAQGFWVPNGSSGPFGSGQAPVGADFVRACQIRNSRLGG